MVRFKLRECYHLRINNVDKHGITKEKLSNYLSRVSTRYLLSYEIAPRTKMKHIQGIVEKENVDLGKPNTRPLIKYIQKEWPTAKGNENIGCPQVEKGILRLMAYLQKCDEKPIIHQVDKKQLEQSRKIAYKENKDGEMKREIKTAKEEWVITEPRGPCGDMRCSMGMHRGCYIAHTQELYNKIGDIYNKYQKDLRIATQQMICRPSCKRMYPTLIRNQAKRANNSMWGEYD